MFLARNSEAIVVIETKLFFSLMKQGLKLGSGQERDGNDMSGSVFTNIHNEMTFGDIQREALFVVALLPSQAGASFQDLLDHCCLWQLV